jgi:cell division protein FtsZ
MSDKMKFDLPKNQSSIIKVVGVGGGGSNAVNHMFSQGIDGVDFLVCNTDQQALDISPVPHKIQLGSTLTEGRGAGSIPEVGKNAAIENIDQIREILKTNTKMVFITAGMGGGTGTGAAPIIAEAAKELGILTVGIVTLPFAFEGRKRKLQASEGIKEIKQYVDTLLVINNDKLREIYGNLSVGAAFDHADNVLTTASKGIAEIITRIGYINVDFEDVRTVMSEGGVAIMGSAAAGGENRAITAVEHALTSPLLNDNNIRGAKYILLNISFGTEELLMDEISDITDYIQDEAGESADIIWGYGKDESLGDQISVTLIATGFKEKGTTSENVLTSNVPKTKVYTIDDEVKTTLTDPFKAKIRSTPKVEEKKEEEEPNLISKDNNQTTQGSIEFDLSNSAPAFKPAKIEPPEEEKSEEPFLKPKSTVSIKPPIIYQLGDIEEVKEPEVESKSEIVDGFEEENQDKIIEEPTLVTKEVSAEVESIMNLTDDERQKRAEERMMRLKNLSVRLKTPNGVTEMENEPAYVRRKVTLNDVAHSSESQVSRYTLSESEDEDGNKRTEIKPNNSFLHDNVD